MPVHSNFTLDLELDSMFQQSTRLVINIQETSSWFLKIEVKRLTTFESVKLRQKGTLSYVN